MKSHTFLPSAPKGGYFISLNFIFWKLLFFLLLKITCYNLYVSKKGCNFMSMLMIDNISVSKEGYRRWEEMKKKSYYYIDRCELRGIYPWNKFRYFTCEISVFSRRNYFYTTISVVVTSLVVLRWIHIRLQAEKILRNVIDDIGT